MSSRFLEGAAEFILTDRGEGQCLDNDRQGKIGNKGWVPRLTDTEREGNNGGPNQLHGGG